MEKKIEIVSMELIKPISPTPNHLRCYEFSVLDQMAFPAFVPLVLFYPPPPHNHHHHHHSNGGESYSYEQAREVNSSRILLIKKSLSETLASFYPFAGRIKDNYIECNDDGVPFYEAFAHNYQFEDVLGNPDVIMHFLPTEDDSIFHDLTICLLVQVTIFKCGGMAICICVSHKVADGATLCTIVNAWAASTAARGSLDYCVVPEFVAAAKFLPPPIPHVAPNPDELLELVKVIYDEQRVSKIFAFDASTVASLKAKVMSDAVPKPTRVEVVSAVIWKCAMAAASGSGRRSSQLLHHVNIRKWLVPPLRNHCVGNVVAIATACKGENDDSDLSTLVTCIRKGLSELNSKFVDKQNQDGAILAIPYDHAEIIVAHLRGEIGIEVSSFCGYQFYVDFGWGQPSWISVNNEQPATNVVVLSDSRDVGGIEASICLKEKDSMALFEHELELLAFAEANHRASYNT